MLFINRVRSNEYMIKELLAGVSDRCSYKLTSDCQLVSRTEIRCKTQTRHDLIKAKKANLLNNEAKTINALQSITFIAHRTQQRKMLMPCVSKSHIVKCACCS